MAKYDVKQKLIVRNDGDNEEIIPSGTGIEISSKLLAHWYVKANIDEGNITISESTKKIVADATNDNKGGKAAEKEAKKIIASAKEKAENIIASAREDADAMIANAKEEAAMLSNAAEEAAVAKVKE